MRRHISAPLHCYTGKAGSVFGNSWLLASGNDFGAMGKREQMHWFLYKQLASHLICFLFYIMIASLLVAARDVAVHHDIHLMCEACTRDGLRQITFVIIQATCIWLLLMHHSMKTLLCSSFWIIQLIMAWTETEDPLVLVLVDFLLSHSQLHSSG